MRDDDRIGTVAFAAERGRRGSAATAHAPARSAEGRARARRHRHRRRHPARTGRSPRGLGRAHRGDERRRQHARRPAGGRRRGGSRGRARRRGAARPEQGARTCVWSRCACRPAPARARRSRCASSRPPASPRRSRYGCTATASCSGRATARSQRARTCSGCANRRRDRDCIATDVAVSALDPKQDAAPEDNEGSTFVRVRGQASALVMERDPAMAAALVHALQSAAFQVDSAGPEGVPADVAGFAAYDLVVLSDISAVDFSPTQLAALASYVRDLGGGLLLMGGDHAMGPGGYGKTPVEEVSPVSFDLKQERRRASLAEVIAIDYSGSMGMSVGGHTKLELANEAAARSAKLLGSSDRLGVMHVDTSVKWTVPLGPVTDKATDRKGDPLGGPRRRRHLRRSVATHRVRGARQGKGQPQARAAVLGRRRRRAAHQRLRARVRGAKARGITTSVVALGRGSDVAALEHTSKLGGGRFYLIEDASRLPAVFAQETILASRSSINEVTFHATPSTPGPPTRGVDFGAGTRTYRLRGHHSEGPRAGAAPRPGGRPDSGYLVGRHRTRRRVHQRLQGSLGAGVDQLGGRRAHVRAARPRHRPRRRRSGRAARGRRRRRPATRPRHGGRRRRPHRELPPPEGARRRPRRLRARGGARGGRRRCVRRDRSAVAPWRLHHHRRRRAQRQAGRHHGRGAHRGGGAAAHRHRPRAARAHRGADRRAHARHARRHLPRPRSQALFLPRPRRASDPAGRLRAACSAWPRDVWLCPRPSAVCRDGCARACGTGASDAPGPPLAAGATRSTPCSTPSRARQPRRAGARHAWRATHRRRACRASGTRRVRRRWRVPAGKSRHLRPRAARPRPALRPPPGDR